MTTANLQYQLNGAAHLTKLDMKLGYMKFELDLAPHHITTFFTHKSLRRSRRSAFGIIYAAEVFHEEITKS